MIADNEETKKLHETIKFDMLDKVGIINADELTLNLDQKDGTELLLASKSIANQNAELLKRRAAKRHRVDNGDKDNDDEEEICSDGDRDGYDWRDVPDILSITDQLWSKRSIRARTANSSAAQSPIATMGEATERNVSHTYID
jgi:hypothetical protein